MIQAIEEMQKCPEHPHKPKVGCIIVRDNATIATGYKGMTKDGSHAEREALDFLEEHSISAAGGTIYTTMEPCIQTNAQCSEKIYEHGINEVVFGSFDVNPKIRGRGYSYLKSKGIAQRGFDEDLHREIDEINSQFMDNFQRSTGLKIIVISHIKRIKTKEG